MKHLQKYVAILDNMGGVPDAQTITKIWLSAREDLEERKRFFDWYDGTADPINDAPKDPDIIDNRIDIAFPARIINTKVGYLFGNPLRVRLNGDRYSDDEKDLLKIVRSENDMSDLDQETGRYSSAAGYCGRLFDLAPDDGRPRSQAERFRATLIEPWLCAFITTGEIYNPEYAFRVWDEERGTSVVKVMRFYSKIAAYTFELPAGQGVWAAVGDPEPVIFGGVPLVGYPANRQLRPDFWYGREKIKAYEKRVSSFDSELEGERHGYTVFQDVEVDKEERRQAQKIGGIKIKSLGLHEAKVYRIEKQLHPDAHIAHLEQLTQDINQDCSHVDWTDEKFGGNLSGVAIKYKILPLENKCITHQQKHEAADRQMYWLLFNWYRTLTGRSIDYRDVSIEWTRNLPPNISEEVGMVAQAKGVVSDETAYGLGKSFIPDPAAEKEAFDSDNPVVRLGNDITIDESIAP